MKEYLEFLEKKKITHADSGFDVDDSELNQMLFPFQKFCVKRALKAGRYALFEDCGLGKTGQQLEWSRHVVLRTGKPVLILAPLAVSGQTILEGEKFGIEVIRWSDHWQSHYQDCNSPMERGHIFITNYEQLDNVDCSLFSGVVLDESSCLKNFMGAIRNKVIEGFANTPYKLCCTASPSPNDIAEMSSHSEFLNIMSRNEMLAMYFVHDGGETSKWRIKGHAEQRMWDWVSGWAIMMNKPSDIGFEDDGFILPKLNLIERQIKTSQRNNGLLFNDTAVSATNFNQELRLTRLERMSEVINIVNNSTESFIIWIKHNEEGEYLKKHIPDAVEVKGSDDREYKEDKLLGFAKNQFRVLITKCKIAMFGLNYQHCHNQIFASLDFSFEATYQGIRRSYRFMQEHPVNVYLLTTDTMQNVIESINRKKEQFEQMQQSMATAMNRNLTKTKKQKLKRMNEEFKNEFFTLKLGDCVQLIGDVKDESVDYTIYSPPFSDLYVYSDELEDMGNSKNYEEFLEAYDYLVRELYRVTKTGRNVSVHCMDLPIQKGKEGYIALRDFSGMIREGMEHVGFVYHSRCTVWRNPVTEMQRSKALGLLHKQLRKDAAMSRQGLPDYVLTFRKNGDPVSPVIVNIPVDTWQKWASPVWMDIDFGNTLNAREAREQQDERHIAALSLDVIERNIALWSNEGDLVLSPFCGIGSEIYQAVKMNRRGLGFELKASYYNAAIKNCMSAVESKKQLQIF